MKRHITTTVLLVLVLAFGPIERTSAHANAVDGDGRVKSMVYTATDDQSGKGINTPSVGGVYVQPLTELRPITAAATARAAEQPTATAIETAATMRSAGASVPATVPGTQDQLVGLGSIVLSTIMATLVLVVILRAIARRRR